MKLLNFRRNMSGMSHNKSRAMLRRRKLLEASQTEQLRAFYSANPVPAYPIKELRP